MVRGGRRRTDAEGDEQTCLDFICMRGGVRRGETRRSGPDVVSVRDKDREGGTALRLGKDKTGLNWPCNQRITYLISVMESTSRITVSFCKYQNKCLHCLCKCIFLMVYVTL